MKKFYLFRNSLLPLLGALAVVCAGSCTKDAVENQDLSGAPETRALTPLLYVTPDPLGTGDNNDRFDIDRTYRFAGTIILPPQMKATVSNVHMMVMSDSNDGYVIENETNYTVDVRFTKPGRYYVNIHAQIGMAYEWGGMTCIANWPIIDDGKFKPVVDLGECFPAD